MKKLIIRVISLVFLSGFVQADVVANYTFSGGSVSSSDTDAGTTAGDYTFTAGGISGTGADDKYTRADDTADTLAAAITAGWYDSFTVSYVSGDGVDFTTLTYDYKAQALTGTFQSYVLVDANNNGFDAGDDLGGFAITGAINNNSINPVSVNLSSLANFTSDSVEFRLYYTDTTPTSTRYHRVDNFVLNADAIPEPGALGLLVIFSTGILFVRRRLG